MAKERDNPRISARPLSDLREDSMIHVVTVRSEAARGRVLSVDVPHLPRGYRAIQASDIPGINALPIFGSDVPILAGERVSYIGEPVLLLAGPSLSILENLRSAVRIEIEVEEPFLSFEKFSSDQILAKRVALSGDPELAFSVAEIILEGRYTTDSQEHWYPEPQGAYASFDYDKLVIRCATQWPFHVRSCASGALGVKPGEIIVRPTPLGVHMDGRLWYPSLLAAHAALASFLCHKPARLLLSREEDFRFTPKKARTTFSLRAALDPTGGVSALDAQIVVNIGAYGPLAQDILEQTCLHAAGSLSVPNMRIEGYAVRTNTLPLGAFAGLGAASAFFAAESLANLISGKRGEDPLEWRSRNVLKKGSPIITGEVLKAKTSFEEISRRLKASSDFSRKHGSYELVRKRRSSSRSEESPRGIGVAFGYQGNGSVFSSLAPEAFKVDVVLLKDLSLEIFTSAIIGNEGIQTIWKQTAAGILGIPEKKIAFVDNTTATVPDSGPSVLSRNIAIVNRLIERCCVGIRSRRFRSPLPISSRSVHRSRSPLVWKDGYVRGYPFESLSCCGAVVEVELNPWSMEPRILDVCLCVDGGKIASERFARRSLAASVIAALGHCMRERLEILEGAVPRSAFRDYTFLSLSEAPPIRIDFVPWVEKDPILGIGDLAFSCVPAAFAGAVAQASDLPVNHIPLVGEEILREMEAS